LGSIFLNNDKGMTLGFRNMQEFVWLNKRKKLLIADTCGKKGIWRK
jgi:hypothetical protein